MRGVEQIPWLYDLGMTCIEATGLGRWRGWLVRETRGRVLDLGCGTGRNLSRLGAGAVGLDPCRETLARAKRRAPAAHVVCGRAEQLPFRAGVFETVTVGLVLCSVDEPQMALGELRRVLAPAGTVRLLEHVRSRHRWQARLQDLAQPMWTRFTGGCRPNRDTEAEVARAGFATDEGSRRARGTLRRFVARAGMLFTALAALLAGHDGRAHASGAGRAGAVALAGRTNGPGPCDLTMGMPPSAERIGVRHDAGPATYRLTETLPDRIEAGGPWDHWLVTPTGDLVPDVVEMAVPLRVDVRTTAGTLKLVVPAWTRARSGDVEGLPVHLCFDPQTAGPAVYPWPGPVAAARAAELLDERQQARLAAVEAHLRDRQVRLVESALGEFREQTGLPRARRELVRLLLHVYDPPVGIDRDRLAPERFLDRRQRERVRALGHDVRGRCGVTAQGGRLRLQLEDCPASQLVRAWNAVMGAQAANSRPDPGLRAVAPGAHEEIDLQLDMPLPRGAAVARAALLALPGVAEAER